MSSSDDDCNQLKRRKRPRTTSLRSNEGGELTETKKLCCMCQSDSIPDIDAAHQQLLEYDNLRAHYFCLLFSSGLGQTGLESEGLHGFMPADVRRELKRGSRLKCVYCKKKGATVGCARQQCKKSYHLPCGIKNGSLQEFFDQFKSYCSSHRPSQKVQRQNQANGISCSLCQEPVIARPCPKSLYAPCCSTWLHRSCVQNMALKQPLTCPSCQDTEDKFAKEMQKFGVYLPQRSETLTLPWDPTTAFKESKVKECGAKVCFCDNEEGRKYNMEGVWDLLVCYSCGSSAIHGKCGGLEDYIDPQWHCYICRRVVRDDQEIARRQKRPINEVWGTALGRKPLPNTKITIMHKSESNAASDSKLSDLVSKIGGGKFDFSNTVTITPIPKNHQREHQASHDFPNNKSKNLKGGVEIRMVVPNATENSQPKAGDITMKLTLEDIIIAGLNKKPAETNYKCTKAFAEQFDQVVPKAEKSPTGSRAGKRHSSFDTEHGSPGDSDYESAQEG
eukprot:04399.XXX_36607_34362_1 [CDS] Oithona nana genome sequencing.